MAEPNAFAVEAAIAAFTFGETWLNELRLYLEGNKQAVKKFIESELPELYLVPSHATYLMWIDCRRVTEDATWLCQFIRKETGLYLSAGSAYGENGMSFVRMNIACPRERLEEGMQRLKKGIELYERVYRKEEKNK
ncbi:MAG: pyridoxal phosphate-dependent aminotransferase [Oscillospiraceae bacterium]|nr:pyridoxal phosphate-dependent aminotransferase [Oscillospiraceae bacterium]